MNNQKKIITIGSILITLIILSMIYLLFPKVLISLNGNKYVELNIGESYEEYGATAKLKSLFQQKNLDVTIDGKVNSQKVGKYIITYKAKNKKATSEVIRVVHVKDNLSPEISIKNQIIGCKKNNLIEYNLVAVDDYDGNVTENVKYEIMDDEITFFVKDSSGNETKITEKIKYIDDEKPKITLNGQQNIYLKVGEEYEEYGATANDSCDGNLTDIVKINGNVDVNTPGTYEITYSVTDKNNKKSTAKRYVIITNDDEIQQKPQIVNGATIYLTFDDGPGPYTESLLNILSEYDVKATFFVTGQFPKYQYLIKKEYELGHAIGIHTYSHKWSIYESVESYLADFKKIESVIYQETGVNTKLFRFPGGSSNTISRNYSKGIMTKLSAHLEGEGYIYFDWTFDSGDTSKKNNSVNAIINNFKLNLKGDGEYIVLMHDIKENTLKALPEIIKYAQSNGYKFEKLSESSPTAHLKIAN